MIGFLSTILEILFKGFSFISKHPLVLKMMIFSFFTGLILFALDFVFDLIRPYVVDSSLLAYASYLGVLQALSLYITIVIAGFGAKQVLAFVRSS